MTLANDFFEDVLQPFFMRRLLVNASLFGHTCRWEFRWLKLR